ncbi:hypothetical protein EG328_004001 [Venturia inaequalis]|uniref:Uncharacterized protein n=1 Tax=Venturia inaequalis TaxID=5025 RepID=A0A8H3VXT3_VENIN|nr:hypothetical protein EG328_004001 [Venturia inaequalis]KAE9994788.1 hypothetical protein EG327_000001 [Venturia inaequalis]
MADDKKKSRPRTTEETGTVLPPHTCKSKTSSKRSSPKAHNGNHPKRVRFASPEGPAAEPHVAASEHQEFVVYDEELGNHLVEDHSDDDQTFSDDEHNFIGRDEVELSHVSRQTPNSAQDEIARVIQQRAHRRLDPMST